MTAALDRWRMTTHSRLSAAAALALSTAAVASTALAHPIDLRSPDAIDAATPAPKVVDLRSPDAVDAASSRPVAETQVLQASPSGFDWGSAGVGAGAMVGFAAIALGGVGALRRRRSAIAPTSLAH